MYSIFVMVNQFNYSSPAGVILFALTEIVITIVRIRKLTTGLEQEVALRTRELTDERDRIEECVRLAIEENREKADLMILQARQAVISGRGTLYNISLYAGTLRNLVGTKPSQATRSPISGIS